MKSEIDNIRKMMAESAEEFEVMPADGDFERFMAKVEAAHSTDLKDNALTAEASGSTPAKGRTQGAETPRHQLHLRRPERRKVNIFRAIAMPVAASVAILICLHTFESGLESGLPSEEQYFAGCTTSGEIYERYCQLVAKSTLLISEQTAFATEEEYDEIMQTLSNITAEPVPMMDQLPEDLSEIESAACLKNHYAARLDGIKELNNYKYLNIRLL